MNKSLFWIQVVLTFAFWPLSFVLNNSGSWLPFLLALLVITLDWIISRKNYKYHYFLYLLLPLLHPGYLFFPLIAILFNLKNTSKLSLLLYFSVLILVTSNSWKPFLKHSIFIPDILATDTLRKKIVLIPNRNLARVFENKTTIFQNKYQSNIFNALDINNYFFLFHPQEIGNNQNLPKYPYLALVPFLVGLFTILEIKNWYWIFSLFASSVTSLAFLNNVDRLDILLYLPVSLIFFYGLTKISQYLNKYFWLFSLVYIFLSIFEFTRLLIFR